MYGLYQEVSITLSHIKTGHSVIFDQFNLSNNSLNILTCTGRAIVQVTSLRPRKEEAHVRSKASLCEIWIGPSVSGIGFFFAVLHSLPGSIILLMPHINFIHRAPTL